MSFISEVTQRTLFPGAILLSTSCAGLLTRHREYSSMFLPPCLPVSPRICLDNTCLMEISRSWNRRSFSGDLSLMKSRSDVSARPSLAHASSTSPSSQQRRFHHFVVMCLPFSDRHSLSEINVSCRTLRLSTAD